jgi:enoyl-[acyl-carrier protein] reductase I
MGFLHGKRALITGIVSRRSIAWGIANAMYREGAQLAFTYPTDQLKDCTDEAANAFGSNLVFRCDVDDDAQIARLFAELGMHWDSLDILVHAIGFVPRDARQGGSLDVITRENFAMAHDISSYGLIALANAARPMMAGHNGAVLTFTHLGSGRALGRYDLVELAEASLEASVRYLALNLGPETTRVNAISSGLIRTLAAAGDFQEMPERAGRHAPLRRRVTIEEIGNVGAFLCSDLASGMTGEITHVDAGCNILG